jgi:hypothetical protein
MMRDFKNMSNGEIRSYMSSMENEYKAVKNKINNLIGKLDELDVEYNNAKKELDIRAKK